MGTEAQSSRPITALGGHPLIICIKKQSAAGDDFFGHSNVFMAFSAFPEFSSTGATIGESLQPGFSAQCNVERKQIMAAEIIKGDNETISTLMIHCATSHKILRMNKSMPRMMSQTGNALLPIKPQFLPVPPSWQQALLVSGPILELSTYSWASESQSAAPGRGI